MFRKLKNLNLKFVSNFDIRVSDFKRESAFTLIELLVAIGVLTFITGIGITLFTSLTGQYDKASSITNLQAEGNRMMEQMARTVRNSSEADDSGGVLTLTIPENADNLEYQANGNCTTVIFSQDSSTLKKVASSCSSSSSCPSPAGCALNQTTTAEVTSSTFATTNNTNRPDEVKIEFSLTAPGSDPSQSADVSFSKTVLTRNY